MMRVSGASSIYIFQRLSRCIPETVDESGTLKIELFGSAALHPVCHLSAGLYSRKPRLFLLNSVAFSVGSNQSLLKCTAIIAVMIKRYLTEIAARKYTD